MNDTTTRSVPGVTFRTKLPLASVASPRDVPGTVIVAPIMGAPVSSTTVPLTLVFEVWAETAPTMKTERIKKQNFFIRFVFNS